MKIYACFWKEVAEMSFFSHVDCFVNIFWHNAYNIILLIHYYYYFFFKYRCTGCSCCIVIQTCIIFIIIHNEYCRFQFIHLLKTYRSFMSVKMAVSSQWNVKLTKKTLLKKGKTLRVYVKKPLHYLFKNNRWKHMK